jgi:hypothetical protein
VDAIVYDVHPALAHWPEYPYRAGRRSFAPASQPPATILVYFLDIVGGVLSGVIHHFARQPDYVVPQRFGVSAILGIMTAVALLFGGLHWLNALPVFYLFFGVLVIAICLVQMFYGQSARLASTISGMTFLPVFIVLAVWFDPHMDSDAVGFVLCVAIGSIPFGALLGYLTGTCAAGIFLVMDALEPYLQGRRPASGAAVSSSSPAGV